MQPQSKMIFIEFYENEKNLFVCLLFYNIFWEWIIVLDKVIIHKSRGEQFLWNINFEIWAGFGLVGDTEKKNGQLLRAAFHGQLFMFSWAIFFLNIVASALKSCIKWK